jgi:hypothetical protein
MRRNFLLLGQSNMSGRGVISEAPAQPNIDRIWLYGNDGVWHHAPDEPLDSGTNQVDAATNDGSNAGVGPGLAFANRMCELYPDDEIGLIPSNKGGSDMLDWRRWWVRNCLYGSTLARCMEVGLDNIHGILWWQGEADTGSTSDAANWLERFSHCMGNMRHDLCNPKLPVVVAILNNLSPPNSPGWSTVRSAQTRLVAPNLAVIPTEGVPFKSDKIHATTEGQQTIGVRYADAMYALLNP